MVVLFEGHYILVIKKAGRYFAIDSKKILRVGYPTEVRFDKLMRKTILKKVPR